ncbi:hypothetical protein ACHAWF_010408 [Thalassiosira exigua]
MRRAPTPSRGDGVGGNGGDGGSDDLAARLARAERRLATPRRVAEERMRHLGVSAACRGGGESLDEGFDVVGVEYGGISVEGGLPAALVSLLEEASRSWSDFLEGAGAVRAPPSPPRPPLHDSPELGIVRRTILLLAIVSRMDPTLAEEVWRAGSPGVCAHLAKEINKFVDATGDELSVEDSDALIELQDEIFEVYSPSASAGRGMPFAALELRSRLPLAYDLTPVRTGNGANRTGGDEDAAIFIGQVTKRQTAQEDVGFVMWPSAIVLSRWLMTNPEVLWGKAVLELGAGCGLVGIVAARIKSSQGEEGAQKSSENVVISDVNELVLENIERNIELNELTLVASVAKLDFYAQSGRDAGFWMSGGEKRERVDVILAADVICCPDDAVAASKTILDALRPGGTAFVVSANSQHRFGVEVFADECKRWNLGVALSSVGDMYGGALLSEGMKSASGYVEGMDMTLFVVTKPSLSQS